MSVGRASTVRLLGGALCGDRARAWRTRSAAAPLERHVKNKRPRTPHKGRQLAGLATAEDQRPRRRPFFLYAINLTLADRLQGPRGNSRRASRQDGAAFRTQPVATEIEWPGSV